jgi:hypothetical protein
MASNQEIEIRWIVAWRDLYEILNRRPDMPCQLPDGSVVDFETCKGWLQDQAYDGLLVGVSRGFVQGKDGAIVTAQPDLQ